jgi:UDP-N-acetylmuramate--alanine ligase
MYPEQKITGIFQPHLFTRTRDFLDKFALELSQLDKVVLLPIYGAREEPIPGITSEALLDKITANKKIVLTPAEAIQDLRGTTKGIILTIGAGDIDQIVTPIKTVLES